MDLDSMPVFDKYEVVKEIAVHQDKAIYRVKDRAGVVYVAKVFTKTYKHPIYESLSRLAHENMPKIHEIVLLEDCFYVIEDCIAGRTLRERLDENGALSKKETLGILMQLCDVLSYLHNQPTPIIHRDITPNNVMITDGGIVKLIDFDIARKHRDDATSDTELIGTKHFAPPEQYGFSQSDPRTDIYALGMLMTVMMTNTYEVQRVKDSQITNVIERCMMLSPDKRFQTVKKLKERLDRISNNKPEPHVKVIAVSAMLIFSAIVISLVVSWRNNEEARNITADAGLEYIFLTPARDTFVGDFGFQLRPTYGADGFDYTVNLPYQFNDMYLHFSPNNLAASAVGFINQFEMWTFDNFDTPGTILFTPEQGRDLPNVHFIPVGEGFNVSIVVTSEDGTATETYIIRFSRQAADSVRLRYIEFSAARDDLAGDFTAELSPSFNPAIFDYTVHVPYSATTFNMAFGPFNRNLPARIYRDNEEFWAVPNFNLITSIVFTTDSNYEDIPYIPTEFLSLGYIPAGEEVVMTIVVFSEDGTRSETYNVRYVRPSASE